MKQPATTTEPSKSGQSNRSRFLLFIVLAIVAFAAAVLFRQFLSFENLVEQESRLKLWQQSQPLALYMTAGLIYVFVTALAIPGAAALSLIYAWLFGFWPALVLISFSSTMGATLSFLISRFLLRDWIQRRFGDRISAFNESLKREGAFYLFTLRLIPAVPFFIINLVMGLTPLKTWTFWWVSQLGMLPGTAVYVWAGSSVPSLERLQELGLRGIFSWQILIAFALLGIFPLVVRRIIGRPGSTQL